VRAEIATMLLDEMKAGNVKALIARAADFYGPGAGAKSVIGVLAFDKLIKGKTPQAFINADLAHSYSFTTDSAKALYILSQRDEAFGQTWHMPTASPALTSREFIRLIAKHTNGTKKLQVVPKFMLQIMSLFNPLIKELCEMLYQNEYTYVFDSSKFEKAFNFKPTPYEQGIKETIEWMKKSEVKLL